MLLASSAWQLGQVEEQNSAAAGNNALLQQCTATSSCLSVSLT